MRSTDRNRQFLTLVTEYRDVAECGLRHLAERADALTEKFETLQGVQAKHLELLDRVLRMLERVEGRFDTDDDPVKIAAEMKAVVSSVERLSRNVEILEMTVAHGAQRDFPWFHIRGDENGHKGKQVEKVWQYLKKHGTCSRSRAVVATFVEDPLGYTKRSALMSECRRLKVEKYRWC